MTSPSSFLEATQKRYFSRGLLIRRDIDIMLEGLSEKSAYLDGIRKQALKHRLEDVQQLSDARRQTWASWDEQLRRLEEWMRSAAELKRGGATLSAWRESAQGFERLQSMSEKYRANLTRREKRLDNDLFDLGTAMQEWDIRLCSREADLRAFLERQSTKTNELMVSKARKQPYLDFVYSEREEEGRLAIRMKNIRAATNTTLERLNRVEEWVTTRAALNPAQFGQRKEAFVESLKPFRKQFSDLRAKALEQALTFEGGRQRLRWIYEQVQRMRVVPDAPAARTPLIQRLFGGE